jgi:hypothetical protein
VVFSRAHDRALYNARDERMVSSEKTEKSLQSVKLTEGVDNFEGIMNKRPNFDLEKALKQCMICLDNPSCFAYDFSNTFQSAQG